MARGDCMQLILEKSIKPNATLLEGFPGFGLVGPIATEFLVEHLQTEVIGRFEYNELPATTAIHKGEVVTPMGLHYNRKRNILILHTMLSVKGFEWRVANEVVNFVKKKRVKEVISLEGVNTMNPNEHPVVYGHGNKKLVALTKPMHESIVIGVTAALLLKLKNVSCIFAETHSGLPDSKAAAAILEILDKYLGIGIDTTPLLAQAEKFEEKLKTLVQQTQQAQTEADRKSLSYLG